MWRVWWRRARLLKAFQTEPVGLSAILNSKLCATQFLSLCHHTFRTYCRLVPSTRGDFPQVLTASIESDTPATQPVPHSTDEHRETAT